MSDDLVKRLREWPFGDPRKTVGWPSALLSEAADRIDALEADNRNLRMELLAVLGQKMDESSAKQGCSVCGLGKDGRATAYTCVRADCPTLARALEGKTHD